jgi:hypothetical protein
LTSSNQLLVLALVFLQLHCLLQVVPHLEEEALATKVTAHGQEPEESVGAQYALKVLQSTTVVRALHGKLGVASSLLAELDSSVLIRDQPKMKREETSDEEAKDAGQHVSRDYEISQFVIYAFSRKNGPKHRV